MQDSLLNGRFSNYGLTACDTVHILLTELDRILCTLNLTLKMEAVGFSETVFIHLQNYIVSQTGRS
jgi:hypothetical protein